LEKGQKQIPFYYENRKHEFNPEDLAEYDFITQNVNINDARITGKIDKMHYDHDLKEIIVYDYKTGKPIHSWEKGSAYDKVKSWKYKNQLIFYKLLVENARDFKQKYKVNKGILEFLEPDNDETILLSLNINHEEVEQMKKLIEVVYKKIINLEFPDTSMYEPSYYGIRSFIEDLLSEA
jgi:CRISPR/Cas system-associated exonuclease Cas4 (RecB family)